jgi:hypothetical protein
MVSCAISFSIALLALGYYSLDPLDQDLIINEQAMYLTHKYSTPQEICTVSSFMCIVERKIYDEQILKKA